MSQLYVRQHFFSLGGHFDVTDANGNTRYTVVGSFFKFPKEFQLLDLSGNEVAKVIHQPFHFLDTFDVDMKGRTIATIRKKITFLRSQYEIDSGAVDVQGSWWGFNFTVTAQGQEVAQIHEDAFSFGHAYELDISNEDYEGLVIALVLAIDYVKAQDSAGASSSST